MLLTLIKILSIFIALPIAALKLIEIVSRRRFKLNPRSKTIPKSVKNVSELSPLMPIVEYGAFAPLVQLAQHLFGDKNNMVHKMYAHLDQYERLCKNEGVLLSVVFGKNIVQVFGAEIARQVFRDEKTFPKVEFNPNSVVSRFLGRNVVFVNGSEWRFHRSMMNPAFADTEVFMPVFLDKSVELCNKFTERVDQDGKIDFRVNDWMARMTVDIIGQTVFDFDFRTMDSQSEFHEIGLKPVTSDSSLPKSVQFLHNYQFLFSRVPDIVDMILPFVSKLRVSRNRDINTALSSLEEMVSELIESSRRKKTNQAKTDEESSANATRMTLLDMMLESEDSTGRRMTDKELRDNILVQYFAGHETTATSLSFGLYELARNADMQQKMLEEVDRVVGLDKMPTYDQLREMDFTRRFINEVMRRWHPAGNIVPKIAARDTELGGYRIPKGTVIHMSVSTYHLQSNAWGPDAMDFNPDRWLKKTPTYAWYPFGGGSRICIGNNFTIAEQIVFYIVLLQRFIVELSPGYEEMKLDASQALLAPVHDFQIRLRRRV